MKLHKGGKTHFILRPRQHRFELPDLRYLEVAAHDHLHHALAEIEKVFGYEKRISSRLDKGQYHIDEFTCWRVSPVVILQWDEHGTDDFDTKKLFGMMEARLKQLRKVVVLGSTDESRNCLTRERTTSGV